MNVSNFLSGNFLTHLDLPLPNQVWTIQQVNQQLVGTDQKICVRFAEFQAKPFGLNKTNLRRIADLYGIQADAWIGKQLQVYRTNTEYAGKRMPCIRVCAPGQATPEAVVDAQGNLLPPNAPTASVANPQPPVAATAQQPAAAPWEQSPPATPQNSPPSA